jgi:hypothetical protein
MSSHLGCALCTLGLILFCLSPGTKAFAQCPAKTQIEDTLYNADGSLAEGRLIVSWPTFRIGSCQVIAGQVSVAVASGALNIQLYPNDAATPSGTSYRVAYYLKSGRVTTEYWVVPTSGVPVILAVVRSSSVAAPAVVVSQAQVTNLVPDLLRKVELPSPCASGKFLQSNGSSVPPQVNCVDGIGAPLASPTQSGTVKIDAAEADPRVYTKATADSLLASKADASHTHSASDTTSGTFDPARLPLPAPTALGGVRSGNCAGTDKVAGISTAGEVTCAADQTGGGTVSQHQTNGINLAANDPVDFQNTASIEFTNPSAGNIQAAVKDGGITASKLSVAGPSGAQLSGIGDANIGAGALSPDRITGTAEVAANKGAAGGYAALDLSSRVIQDPASAQATPAAGKIPLADGAGKIADGWLSTSVSLLGESIGTAEIENGSVTDGKLASSYSGTGACTNQFVRALNRDAAPACASVATADISDANITPAKLSAAARDRAADLVLFDPVAGDTNKVQLQFQAATTLQKVACSTDAGTVSINLDKRSETTPNTAGTNALASALVCDSNREETTSFSSATVAANQVLNLQITGTAGSPGVVRIHILARPD